MCVLEGSAPHLHAHQYTHTKTHTHWHRHTAALLERKLHHVAVHWTQLLPTEMRIKYNSRLLQVKRTHTHTHTHPHKHKPVKICCVSPQLSTSVYSHCLWALRFHSAVGMRECVCVCLCVFISNMCVWDECRDNPAATDQ